MVPVTGMPTTKGIGGTPLTAPVTAPVRFLLIVMRLLAASMATMREPAGMPVPVTSMPWAKLVVKPAAPWMVLCPAEPAVAVLVTEKSMTRWPVALVAKVLSVPVVVACRLRMRFVVTPAPV